MSNFDLVKTNIPRMLDLIIDPIMAEFVAPLSPINALLMGVLALSGGSNLSAEMPPVYDDDFIIINLTV